MRSLSRGDHAGRRWQFSALRTTADFLRRVCVRKTLLTDTHVTRSLPDGAQVHLRLGTSHTLDQFINKRFVTRHYLGSSHPHCGIGTATGTGHGGRVGARTASTSAPARWGSGGRSSRWRRRRRRRRQRRAPCPVPRARAPCRRRACPCPCRCCRCRRTRPRPFD